MADFRRGGRDRSRPSGPPPSPKSQYDVLLVPVEVQKGEAKIKAIVVKDGVPVKDTLVIFMKNKVPEIGDLPKTDDKGEALHVFKGLKGDEKLGAEAIVPDRIKPRREISVTTDDGKEEKSDKGPRILNLIIYPPQKNNAGDYRITGFVHDDSQRGIAAQVRASGGNVEFKINGDTVAAGAEKEISIPSSGLLDVRVSFNVPRLKIRFWLPSRPPIDLNLFGPEPEPEPAKPGDGTLKHLTNGWK